MSTEKVSYMPAILDRHPYDVSPFMVARSLCFLHFSQHPVLAASHLHGKQRLISFVSFPRPGFSVARSFVYASADAPSKLLSIDQCSNLPVCSAGCSSYANLCKQSRPSFLLRHGFGASVMPMLFRRALHSSNLPVSSFYMQIFFFLQANPSFLLFFQARLRGAQELLSRPRQRSSAEPSPETSAAATPQSAVGRIADSFLADPWMAHFQDPAGSAAPAFDR